MNNYHNHYLTGLKDGLPIGLGYLSVSITIGIAAINAGLPAWSAILMSLTNLTSAGQVEGIAVIAALGSYFELALTQLTINLRYFLMSLTLSQKMDDRVTLPQRLIVSFGITDEIFAVSSAKIGNLGCFYMLGLMTLPIIGWTAGTALGAVAGSLLPEFIRSALGIAVYGMFLAIIIPPAKKERTVLIAVVIAAALSCALTYIPYINQISGGFAVIIFAVAASAFCAWKFPIKDEPAKGEAPQ